MKIRDFKGKNYRFRLEPLFDSLAVEKCKMTLKSNSISLTLGKENEKAWDRLKFSKAITSKGSMKEAADQKKDKPVSDELMTMMQDLYTQGGDDVKRTISEAWTKAQDTGAI